MKDGSGVINLAALGDSEEFLIRNQRVQLRAGDSKLEDFATFSPCKSFSEPAGLVNCSHVAVCVMTRNPLSPRSVPQYVAFGLHEDNEFSYSNESKILSVTYPAVSGSPLRTIVHFNCSPSSSITFHTTPPSPDLLEIFVQSPCVCPSSCQAEDVGPSTIILILFAASTTVYFLFGTCSLRSVRTSEGIQITPGPHIWCWICHLLPRQREARNRLLDSL
ncbi:uncharacterized protein O3C94_011321 [Discoglossus pictus]